MAQNYINYFETDSLYNAAKSGLSQPNVSFVKESGNIHYTKHLYGLAASELGDIILEDSTKLYSVNPDNYNLTDFPIATYKPIGINVIPGSETTDGMARVLSMKFISRTNPGNGIYFNDNTSNGEYMVAWGPAAGESGISGGLTSTSLLNGKAITQSIINTKQTVDWSGSSIPYNASDGHYPAFCFASRYHTTVTQEGDWYVPSFKELHYAFSINRTYLQYSFETIINIARTNINFASNFIFDKSLILLTCNQYASTGTYVNSALTYSSNETAVDYAGINKQKNYTNIIIPMLQIGVTEV